MKGETIRRTGSWLLAAAAAAALALPAGGDSLYVPGKSRSMFGDRKARVVGDVLTVLVTENTVASQDADLATQRKLEASASGGSGFFMNLLNLVPKATLGGSTKHQGNGATARSTRVVSTITVRVTELTPGGQLMLTGERIIKTNKDTQTIKFTGVCRPEDVQPDNTISSGAVADMRIEVTGRGPIDRSVRPGILSRIFELLF